MQADRGTSTNGRVPLVKARTAARSAAALLRRLELPDGTVRLEVEDPGRDGTVAARPPDLDAGGGFGLNLVQRLAERWGIEPIAAGGTRVRAEIGQRI
jgi:hypothetical protein